ncbi:MAG: VOC family protein [Oscillospiraceae bacterium]|jgi:predicted 3-demethylubiquinone-9 3-methyltransferase (glyoxalase superfamily)|nr:VOC family protein [Oscillospiraceae bacterium]
MQKIAPCIWCDRDALEAAELYVSAFENSRVEHVTHYLENDASPSGLPAGTPLTVRFTLCGQEFNALNGGPVFRPTPAVSFYVACESETQMNALWDKLSAGGTVLMEVAKYPFSERFGWLADRFGVSWQISLSDGKQRISPYLMFTEKVSGRAEEAIQFYADVFGKAEPPQIFRYGKDADGVNGIEGNVMLASFWIAGQGFMAADSAYPHGFTFNEGISFLVYCHDQHEIDMFWIRLAEGGEEQPCGWLKDKFGLSWQIVPRNIEKLADCADPVRAKRVNAALMKMGKINVQALQDAYGGQGRSDH